MLKREMEIAEGKREKGSPKFYGNPEKWMAAPSSRASLFPGVVREREREREMRPQSAQNKTVDPNFKAVSSLGQCLENFTRLSAPSGILESPPGATTLPQVHTRFGRHLQPKVSGNTCGVDVRFLSPGLNYVPEEDSFAVRARSAGGSRGNVSRGNMQHELDSAFSLPRDPLMSTSLPDWNTRPQISQLLHNNKVLT